MKFNRLHEQYLEENKLAAFKSFQQDSIKKQVDEAIWDNIDDPVIYWVSDNVVRIYNVYEEGYTRGEPIDVQMHKLSRELGSLNIKVESWDIQRAKPSDMKKVMKDKAFRTIVSPHYAEIVLKTSTPNEI